MNPSVLGIERILSPFTYAIFYNTFDLKLSGRLELFSLLRLMEIKMCFCPGHPSECLFLFETVAALNTWGGGLLKVSKQAMPFFQPFMPLTINIFNHNTSSLRHSPLCSLHPV